MASVEKSKNDEMIQTDDETSLKWRFAEELLRNPNDPFRAAMNIVYDDTVAALTLMDRCLQSTEIAQMKAQLVEELGEDEFLPSEGQIIRDILTRAERTNDDGDYVKLMSLVLDARGMTSKAKASTSVVVNNTTNNQTMHVPVMVNSNGKELSDDEWEASLIEQQENLITVH